MKDWIRESQSCTQSKKDIHQSNLSSINEIDLRCDVNVDNVNEQLSSKSKTFNINQKNKNDNSYSIKLISGCNWV